MVVFSTVKVWYRRIEPTLLNHETCSEKKKFYENLRSVVHAGILHSSKPHAHALSKEIVLVDLVADLTEHTHEGGMHVESRHGHTPFFLFAVGFDIFRRSGVLVPILCTILAPCSGPLCCHSGCDHQRTAAI
jgi:hypothetical protein